MQYDHFIGQVQHRARLASRGEAVSAIRATLETLAERLVGGAAKDIASQLPKEIGIYLRNPWQSQRFSLREFYYRASLRENVHLTKAIHHARAVISVLREAVSKGEMGHLRAQLPAEFNSLFNLETGERATAHGFGTTIKQIETHHPEVISPEASLLEAAQKMKKLDVGMLPVCAGGQIIGMLTDRDITIRATAEGRDPRAARVSDVMTPNAICCYEDEDVAEAARVMEEKQIRRLPIKDRHERLVGVVSLGDLAVRNRNEHLTAEVLEKICEHNLVTVTSA